jgi:nucleoid DNA-binding protein
MAKKSKKPAKKVAKAKTKAKGKATKKAAAKKPVAKKATAKVAKKSAAKTIVAKAVKTVEKRSIGPARVNFDNVNRVRSKGQTVTAISTSTGLSKREVNELLDSLQALVGHDLSTTIGVFTLPGLMKMIIRKKPATKARKGVNPFTGEEMTFKAKPASNVVRARPLKQLKDQL